MIGRRTPASRPLPRDFLEWQVALRRFTMDHQNGAPHMGVAPLVCVREADLAAGLGVGMHSVICGLLPRADSLENKTREFRELYEQHIGEGARAVYDRGIAYLKGYYRSADDFDPGAITTLLPEKLPVVDALRAEPRCALLFHVFDLTDRSEVGRYRCVQIDAHAEVLDAGPVYDNVWWHNALFHGPTDEHVVLHFRHRGAWNTAFGALEALS